MKSSALTILASFSLAAVLHAQGAPVAPARTFEVASIKETRSFETRAAFFPGPAGINIQHATAQEIIAWAHDMLAHDVAGGPDWVRSTRFYVTATAGGAPLKPSELRPMVRALLATRFGLDAAIEPVEKSVYALVRIDPTGPSGPDLKPRTECKAPPDEFKEVSLYPVQVARIEGCGITHGTSGGRLSGVIGYGATMQELAKVLSRYLDRPVIDRTALTGKFDFFATSTPGGMTRDAAGRLVPVVEHSAFDLHPSLQDRLGLKLESTRAEVPTVVIRRIQQPKGN